MHVIDLIGLVAPQLRPREVADLSGIDDAHDVPSLMEGNRGRGVRLLPDRYEPVRSCATSARGRLDELTCTTIHGLRIQLQSSPGTIRSERKLLRKFAEFRRDHRTARPLPSFVNRTADQEFIECVAEFRRWFASAGGPPEAEQDINELEQLAEHFRGKFDPAPSFEHLWELAHPPQMTIVRSRGFDLQRYQRRGAWQRKRERSEGARLADEAAAHYDRCAEAFRELMGSLATAIASVFSAELDALLRAFEEFKRSAAVVDFDDLLYITRRVLREHEVVRQAAADRYSRIWETFSN